MRLLAGLDGNRMTGLCKMYEQKYQRPLASALRKELSGNFKKAAVAWLRALQDPSRGLEATTEQDVSKIAGDCEKLNDMIDDLLKEHNALTTFIATLDVERLAEACVGVGTDDTSLIKVISTRDKRFLSRVSKGYRAFYKKDLSEQRRSHLAPTKRPR